jgi:cellulose synthase/poly-beta-1,6-N-acetylglucosamine synthase-like glycosyltransferase
MGIALVQAVCLFSMVVFLAYVATIIVPFLNQEHEVPGRASDFDWHIFVPARDEDAVIEATVRRLRATFTDVHVWVIDDDSDDATAHIVTRLCADPRVHLVQRRRPKARTGKGDALNAGHAALTAWLPPSHDPSRTIVGVVDADGTLGADALDLVAGPRVFGDDRVGGVQIGVRMANRHDRCGGPASSSLGSWFARFLVRMQDFEFAGPISAMQSLREKTGSVALGGNGQFTRLSVLTLLADTEGTPWHGALLEDFELGVHILLAGYQNRFVPAATVNQEAVESARRLIAQRARWSQGSMQCSLRYLVPVLRSPHFSTAGAVEAAYFLIAPWTQVFGVVYWPALYAAMAYKAVTFSGGVGAFIGVYWMLGLVTLLTGTAPFVIWGPIIRRVVDPTLSRTRALVLGCEYALYLVYQYPTTLRAFGRLLAGRTGWAKTRRNAEAFTPGPVALDA